MTTGIGPLDEFPIHQAALPVAWAASSDRNFYDRCYLNAHDRSGEIFVITGAGWYPNLGTKDAFVLVRRGDEQTAVHLSDAIDDDRLSQSVGNYRIEVIKPLQKLRVVLEETDGIAMDLTWEGSFPVVREMRHVMRAGSRVTLDAQRFAQVGTWSGALSIDGAAIEMSPDTWVGTRDRSWGIRPVGQAAPEGAPLVPAFEGMWWLYVPLRFGDFAIVLILQEDPGGYRTLNDCHRIWNDGRVEQLGWPRVDIHYASGTRHATGATIQCSSASGDFVLEVSSLLDVPLHVGGGYGGDPDWIHGMWKGPAFTERVTYDMASAGVVGRKMFGVVDHVGRGEITGPSGTAVGWGLFEVGVLGRHDPSGFTDWFTLAP